MYRAYVCFTNYERKLCLKYVEDAFFFVVCLLLVFVLFYLEIFMLLIKRNIGKNDDVNWKKSPYFIVSFLTRQIWSERIYLVISYHISCW